nr:hypothetical protein [Tanacetum cinerariifolium]
MLESKAYMTYCAYATGEKSPKPKSTKKKADSESYPKMKPTQASKGKRIKTSSKGDKPVKMKQSATKSKGLTVLSEAALSKADQMKLATKRSKKEFHISHAISSGDGVDINEDDNDEHDSANDNDDEDDDQDNVSEETESDDDKDDFVHPNLSTYNTDDQEEEDEEEKANDDDEVFSDPEVSTPPNYEIPNGEDNQEDDDKVMGGEKEDEELVSSLKSELSELKQTNQFGEAVSSISGIVDNYLGFKMKDTMNVAVQLQSNKLREEAQAENDEFLKQIDSNIKAIIKDQAKAQVSKILPKVKKYVTKSLRAELLTRSSNQPQTSYAAVASLSEFELKKILIDKIKENKSMHRSDV